MQHQHVLAETHPLYTVSKCHVFQLNYWPSNQSSIDETETEPLFLFDCFHNLVRRVKARTKKYLLKFNIKGKVVLSC